ncbi:uncharacterized protein BXZ73DRAFT_107960 [Epithele typhae]|uniref:uncharacterized protein n=1 Tax=Epithele typhae TaxID=378194 RepID=UPI002007E3F1|nr:uncharacterized protein BXZ73DRAFT_107960 [Epithele typhae]KAH9911480.1 hypothetical protein BXZ73DRAFT_107960 [Epithele typhae]
MDPRFASRIIPRRLERIVHELHLRVDAIVHRFANNVATEVLWCSRASIPLSSFAELSAVIAPAVSLVLQSPSESPESMVASDKDQEVLLNIVHLTRTPSSYGLNSAHLLAWHGVTEL